MCENQNPQCIEGTLLRSFIGGTVSCKSCGQEVHRTGVWTGGGHLTHCAPGHDAGRAAAWRKVLERCGGCCSASLARSLFRLPLVSRVKVPALTRSFCRLSFRARTRSLPDTRGLSITEGTKMDGFACKVFLYSQLSLRLDSQKAVIA
jgi:hypothetical protein